MGPHERYITDTAIASGVCEGCPAVDSPIELARFRDSADYPYSRDSNGALTIRLAGSERSNIQNGTSATAESCRDACGKLAAHNEVYYR